jgi:hypothetical protein
MEFRWISWVPSIDSGQIKTPEDLLMPAVFRCDIQYAEE